MSHGRALSLLSLCLTLIHYTSRPALMIMVWKLPEHSKQQPLMKGDLEMGQTNDLSKDLPDPINELPQDLAQEPEQQPAGTDAAEAGENSVIHLLPS